MKIGFLSSWSLAAEKAFPSLRAAPERISKETAHPTDRPRIERDPPACVEATASKPPGLNDGPRDGATQAPGVSIVPASATGVRAIGAGDFSALLILVLLPIVLVASGATWVFTKAGAIDAWVYHGYFLHLKSHLKDFAGTYYGTRLPWILPGYVMHSIFGPLTANALLRLMVCWTSALSAFFLLRRSHGPRCALIVGLLLLSYPDFLSEAGSDYICGAAIAYILLCFEELDAAARGIHTGEGKPFLRAALAGAAYGAAFFTHLFTAVYFPIACLFFIARSGKKCVHSVVPFVIGFISLTGVLGLINLGLGGKSIFFFAPQFSTAASLLSSKANPWYLSPSQWAYKALWLVVPFAVAMASVPFLCRAAIAAWRKQERESVIRAVDLTVLLLAIGFHTAIEIKGMPYLQFSYYTAAFTIPLSVTVGAMIGRRLDGMSRLAFGALALSCIVLAILVGTDFPAWLPSWLAHAYSSMPAQVVPLTLILSGAIVLSEFVRPKALARLILAAGVAITLLDTGVNQLDESAGSRGEREQYLLTSQVSRWLEQADHGKPVWFWYAYNSSTYHLTSIASTYLWASRLLGKQLPDPSDLHIGYLQEGVYVALMDHRPEIVEQGAQVLSEKGLDTERAGRLDWAVDSKKFSLLLLKITGQPSRILTTASVSAPLVLMGQIVNDGTQALAKDLYCVPYGTRRPDHTRLPLGVLRETDPRDHCAGEFQTLTSGVAALRVTITDNRPEGRYGASKMILQDQGYNTIYGAGTVIGRQRQDIVPIPYNIHSVRITFLPNSEGYIIFPERVQLETLGGRAGASKGSATLAPNVTDQPSKIMTTSLTNRPLVPMRQIFNDETQALAKDLACIPYGSKKPDRSRLSLGILPETDPKDHCAAPFQGLPAGVAALRVTLTDNRPKSPYGTSKMILQDQGYNTIYDAGTVTGKQRQDIVTIPSTVHSVRITFLPNSEGYIIFPERVQLETLKAK